jgi:hypothetical protein
VTSSDKELLIGRVAERLTPRGAAGTDPRPGAIVGAAFACMQAAREAWFASDRSEDYGRYVDDAMASLRIDE